MTTWKKKMRDIINASQENVKSHDRLLTDLRQIFDSVEKKPFTSEFLRLLVYPLGVEAKSVYVDNCISFLVKFAVSTAPNNDELDEEEYDESNVSLESPIGFFLASMRFTISALPSTNKAVRARACQVLGTMLAECGAQDRTNAISDSKLWDQLLSVLVDRCKDKCVRVRQEAVSALSRLQQPTDKNCSAIAALIFLMKFDPSPDIRSQCIHVISTTKVTISCFMERCRDNNRAVRAVLYKEIAIRKLFKYLTIEQRLTIVKRGLADPDESVRQSFEQHVIPSWLEAVNNSIPELVNRLDMVTSRKTCESLLDALFKQKATVDLVDTFSTMTDGWQNQDWVKPECIFSLRHFIKFILADQQAKDKRRFAAADIEEWMDKLLPSLYALTEFVETYITKDTSCEELDIIDGAFLRNFTVGQFIELLALVDKSDMAGRNRVEKMFEAVIPVVDTTVLPALVRLHQDLHRSVQRTIEWMAEVISDWTVAPAQSQPVAINFPDQSVSYLQLDALSLHDEDEPGNEKAALNLFKSLTVLAEVLKLTDVTTLTTTLRSLYENLVLPAIQNPDPATRNLAFRCLGLSCLLDKRLASQHVDLFLQTLKVDVDIVRKTAVEVLFDLLLVYRTKIFEDKEPKIAAETDAADGKEVNPKNPKTPQMVTAELEAILDSDDVELHDIVADGIAKIRIYAPKLLSKERVENTAG